MRYLLLLLAVSVAADRYGSWKESSKPADCTQEGMTDGLVTWLAGHGFWHKLAHNVQPGCNAHEVMAAQRMQDHLVGVSWSAAPCTPVARHANGTALVAHL